jgi:hypothetical protein
MVINVVDPYLVEYKEEDGEGEGDNNEGEDNKR